MKLEVARSRILRKIALVLLSAFLGIPFSNFAEPVSAQTRKNARSFEGKWFWGNYLKRSDPYDVPEGFDRQKDPYEMLSLNITQNGNKLIGEVESAVHYAGRTDEGDFTAVVKGSTAEVEVQSGHGAKVTVRLREERGRLSWRIIKVDRSGGDYFFPRNVWLRRIKRNS